MKNFLKGTITRLLQQQLSKFIKDINVDGFGIVGDFVLYDLELRLDVLQAQLDELGIPLELTRGFVQKLSITVPWFQLLSKPVVVRISAVEVVVTAKTPASVAERAAAAAVAAAAAAAEQRAAAERAAAAAAATPSAASSAAAAALRGFEFDLSAGFGTGDFGTDSLSPPTPAAAASATSSSAAHVVAGPRKPRSWVERRVRAILANASISIENIVIKYVQKDAVCSVLARSIHIFSADPPPPPSAGGGSATSDLPSAEQKRRSSLATLPSSASFQASWTPRFQLPSADLGRMHKVFELFELTVTLEPSRSSRQRPHTTALQLRPPFEVPFLERTSVYASIFFCLNPREWVDDARSAGDAITQAATAVVGADDRAVPDAAPAPGPSSSAEGAESTTAASGGGDGNGEESVSDDVLRAIFSAPCGASESRDPLTGSALLGVGAGPDARIGGACAFLQRASEGAAASNESAEEEGHGKRDDDAPIEPLVLVLSVDMRVQPCTLTPGVLQLNVSNRHLSLLERITQHFQYDGMKEARGAAAEGIGPEAARAAADAMAAADAKTDAASSGRRRSRSRSESSTAPSDDAPDRPTDGAKSSAATDRVATQTIVRTGGGPIAVSVTLQTPAVCVRVVRHVLSQAAVERWSAHRARKLDAALLSQQEAVEATPRTTRVRSSSAGRSTTRLLRVPVPKSISLDGVVEITVSDDPKVGGASDADVSSPFERGDDKASEWSPASEDWDVTTVLELTLDGVSFSYWMGVCGGQNGVPFRAVNADVGFLLESAAVHWQCEGGGDADESCVKLLEWGDPATMSDSVLSLKTSASGRKVRRRMRKIEGNISTWQLEEGERSPPKVQSRKALAAASRAKSKLGLLPPRARSSTLTLGDSQRAESSVLLGGSLRELPAVKKARGSDSAAVDSATKLRSSDIISLQRRLNLLQSRRDMTHAVHARAVTLLDPSFAAVTRSGVAAATAAGRGLTTVLDAAMGLLRVRYDTRLPDVLRGLTALQTVLRDDERGEPPLECVAEEEADSVPSARHVVELPMRLPEWQRIQILVTFVGVAASTDLPQLEPSPSTAWVLLRVDNVVVAATADGSVGLASPQTRQTTEIDASLSAAVLRVDAGCTRNHVNTVPPSSDAKARVLVIQKPTIAARVLLDTRDVVPSHISSPDRRSRASSQDIFPEVAAAASAISATRTVLAGGEESLRWVTGQLHDQLHHIGGISPEAIDLLSPTHRSRNGSRSSSSLPHTMGNATQPDHGFVEVSFATDDVKLLVEPLLYLSRIGSLVLEESMPSSTELQLSSAAISLSLDTTDLLREGGLGKSHQLVVMKVATRVQSVGAHNNLKSVLLRVPCAGTEIEPAVFCVFHMAYVETLHEEGIIHIEPQSATVQLRTVPIEIDMSPARESIVQWRPSDRRRRAVGKDVAPKQASTASIRQQPRSSLTALIRSCMVPTSDYVGPTVGITISQGKVRLSPLVECEWGVFSADGRGSSGPFAASRSSWSQQISLADLNLRVRSRRDSPAKYFLAPVTVVATVVQRTVLETSIDISSVKVYLSYGQLRALQHALFVDSNSRASQRAAAPVKPEHARRRSRNAPWPRFDSNVSVRAPEIIVTISLVDVPSLPLRASQMVRAHIDTLSVSCATKYMKSILGYGELKMVRSVGVSIDDVEVCEVTRPTLPALPSEALRQIYRFVKRRRRPAPHVPPQDSGQDAASDGELSEEEDVDGNDGCGWGWRSLGFFLLRAQQGNVRSACLDPLQATPLKRAPSQIPLPLLITAVGSEPGSLFHCNGPFFKCDTVFNEATDQTSISARVKPFDLTLRLNTIEGLKALAHRPGRRKRAPEMLHVPRPRLSQLSIVLERVQVILPNAPVLAGQYEETHIRLEVAPVTIIRPLPASVDVCAELSVELGGVSLGRGQWKLHPVRDLSSQLGMSVAQSQCPSSFFITKYTRPAVEDRLGGTRIAMFWTYPPKIMRDVDVSITKLEGSSAGGPSQWKIRCSAMPCTFTGDDGRVLLGFARFKGTTIRQAWALCDDEIKAAAPQCWERPRDAAAHAAQPESLDEEYEALFESCDDSFDDSDEESDDDGFDCTVPGGGAKQIGASVTFTCPDITVELTAARHIDLSLPKRGENLKFATVTLTGIDFTNQSAGDLPSALSFGRVSIIDPQGELILSSAESQHWVPGEAAHPADFTASWGHVSASGPRGELVQEMYVRMDVPNAVCVHLDHTILRRFLGGVLFSSFIPEDEWLRAFAYAAAPAAATISTPAEAREGPTFLEKRSRRTGGFERLRALQRGQRPAKRVRFAICVDACNINMSTQPGSFESRLSLPSGALRFSKLICKFGFTTGGEMGRLLSDHYELVLSAPHLVLWNGVDANCVLAGLSKEDSALLFLATAPSTVVRLAGSHTTGSHHYDMPVIRAWLTKERIDIFCKAMLAIARGIPLPGKRKFTIAPPKFQPRVVTRSSVDGCPHQRAYATHCLQTRAASKEVVPSAPIGTMLDSHADLLIGHPGVRCQFGSAPRTTVAVAIAEEDFSYGALAPIGILSGMRLPCDADFAVGGESDVHYSWVEWSYRQVKRIHRLEIDSLALVSSHTEEVTLLDADGDLQCILSRWDSIAERFLPIVCFALPFNNLNVGATSKEEGIIVPVPRATPPASAWRVAWKVRYANQDGPMAQKLSRIVAASLQVVLTLHATSLLHHGGSGEQRNRTQLQDFRHAVPHNTSPESSWAPLAQERKEEVQNLTIAIESISVEIVTSATAAQLRAPTITGGAFASLHTKSDAFAETTASYAAIARLVIHGVRFVLALRPRATTLFTGADAKSIQCRRQLPIVKLQCREARLQVQDLHQLLWINAIEPVAARISFAADGLLSLSLTPRLRCNLSPTVVAGLSAAVQALVRSPSRHANPSTSERAAEASSDTSMPAFAEKALPELRYEVRNRTGESLWFGQHATPEALRLVPHSTGGPVSVAYSLWHSTSTPQLRFALDRATVDLSGDGGDSAGSTATYSVWTESVPVRVGCHCRMVRRAVKGVIPSTATNSICFAQLWITIERVGMQTRITVDSSHEVRSFWSAKIYLRPIAPTRSPAITVVPTGGELSGMQLTHIDFQAATDVDDSDSASAPLWSEALHIDSAAVAQRGETAQLLSINGKDRLWCVVRPVQMSKESDAGSFGQMWRQIVGNWTGKRFSVEFWPMAVVLNELSFPIDSALFQPGRSDLLPACSVETITPGAFTCLSSEQTEQIALLLSVGIRRKDGRSDANFLDIPLAGGIFREAAAVVEIREGEAALVTVVSVCRRETRCGAFVVRVAPAARAENRTGHSVILRRIEPTKGAASKLREPLHVCIPPFSSVTLPWAPVKPHSPSTSRTWCSLDAPSMEVSLGSEDPRSVGRWSGVFSAKSTSAPEEDCECFVGRGDICWVEYQSTVLRQREAEVSTIVAPLAGSTPTSTRVRIRSSYSDTHALCAALARAHTLCDADWKPRQLSPGDKVVRDPVQNAVLEIWPSLVLCNATPFAIAIKTPLGVRRLKSLHTAESSSARESMTDALGVTPDGSSISDGISTRISCDAEQSWSDPFFVTESMKRQRLLVPTQRQEQGCGSMKRGTTLLTCATVESGSTLFMVVFCDSQPPLMVQNTSSYTLECGASDVQPTDSASKTTQEDGIVPMLCVVPGSSSEFDWVFSTSSAQHARGSTAGAAALPRAWAQDSVFGRRKELKSLGLTAALVGCSLRFRCSVPGAGRTTRWSARVSCTPGHQRVTFSAMDGKAAAELKLHVFCHAGTWVLHLADVISPAPRTQRNAASAGPPAPRFRFRMCIPEISLSLFTEMRLGSRIQSESESDTVALATAGTKRKGQELALSWRARLHGVQKMLQQREKRMPQIGCEVAHIRLRGLRVYLKAPSGKSESAASASSSKPLPRKIEFCRSVESADASTLEPTISGMGTINSAARGATVLSPRWSVWETAIAVSSCQIDGFTLKRASATASPVLFRGPLSPHPRAPSGALNSSAVEKESALDALRLIVVTASPIKNALSARTPRAAFLETVAVQLAPCIVVIDDQITKELLSSVSDVLSAVSLGSGAGGGDVKEAKRRGSDGFEIDRVLPTVSSKAAASRMYVGSLYIAPVRATLTLCIASPVALSLERVPLSFNEVQLRRIFAAPRRIAEELAANYIADAILMSPALLGSLQVLGNPVSLIRALASGVGELVAAPVHAVRNGSGVVGMAVALASGGRYLVSRTVGGLLTSFAGMTTALARNIDKLSFDGEHVSRREELRQLQRRSELVCLTPITPDAPRMQRWPLVNGLWGGFFSVGSSVLSGVGGIVALPFATVASLATGEGVGGAASHIARGVTSVVTKPIAGALDAMSHTSEGIIIATGCSDATGRFMALRAARMLTGELNVELCYRWKKLPTPMRGHLVRVFAALHVSTVEPLPSDALRAHDVILVVCSRELHVLQARDDAPLLRISYDTVASVDVVGFSQLAQLALPESFAAHAVEVRLRSNSSSNSSAHGGGALFCVESARLKQELFTLLAGCVQLEHER